MIGGCVRMIISNEKKFIYLRVPKTGSTSASVFFFNELPLEKSIIRSSDKSTLIREENSNIIPSNYFNGTYDFLGGVHATLQEVEKSKLLQYPLNEYDVYAVCRNPIDRFLSFCSMFKKTDNVDIVSNFTTFKQYMSMFECSPQALWLMHNNTLLNKVFLYENLNALIAEISEKYNIGNVDKFKSYQLRCYDKPYKDINKKALEYIKVIWAKDFEIYANLKNYPAAR